MDQQEEYTGMSEAEVADVDTLRLINALGAVDFKERSLVDVLFTWGKLYGASAHTDEVDSAVLAALISVRDGGESP